MAIKAKDLAKKLGVSPATVSLVLNNRPGISNSLRHTLIDKIKALGCEDMLNTDSAKKAAVSPVEYKSRPTIAYLIYTASTESSAQFAFYPGVLEGAEFESRDNNYRLTVLHLDCSRKNNLNNLLKFDSPIGAIVQANYVSQSIIDDLNALGIPYVFIDSYQPLHNVSCVSVNNERGMYLAVEHLKEMGHSNIGYLSSGHESDSNIERRKFFHQALRGFSLKDERKNFFSAMANGNDGDLPSESELSDTLWSQWNALDILPTAIVAENDILAWRTIKALSRGGYRVPDDISIIGFDDRSICTMVEPNLTTIRNSRHLMGREAVLLLKNQIRLRKLGYFDTALKLEIACELISRDSVKCLNDTQTNSA